MKTRKFLALLLLAMMVSFSGAQAADRVVPVDPGAASDDPFAGGGDEVGVGEDLPISSENPLDNADDLPPPNVGQGPRRVGGQAPVSEPYLPAQGSTPPQYYTPQAGQLQPLPVVGAETGGVPGMVGYGTDFYRDTSWDRPAFQMFVGPAAKSYPTVLVPDAAPGASAGLSVRVMSLGQTVFLHALGSISWFRVGPVRDWANVRDITYHLGGALEFALGRKFSVLGAITRRWNDIFTDNSYQDERQLANIGEEARLKIGLGAQYDFYVIPHGSLGARLYGEKDYALLSLIMAIEPAPQKKMSLNYRNLE